MGKKLPFALNFFHFYFTETCFDNFVLLLLLLSPQLVFLFQSRIKQSCGEKQQKTWEEAGFTRP